MTRPTGIKVIASILFLDALILLTSAVAAYSLPPQFVQQINQFFATIPFFKRLPLATDPWLTVGAGLSLGGLIPTAASNSGVRLVVKGFSVIPLLGNAVSLVATANDVFGENGAVSTFKNCINGTHP